MLSNYLSLYISSPHSVLPLYFYSLPYLLSAHLSLSLPLILFSLFEIRLSVFNWCVCVCVCRVISRPVNSWLHLHQLQGCQHLFCPQTHTHTHHRPPDGSFNCLTHSLSTLFLYFNPLSVPTGPVIQSGGYLSSLATGLYVFTHLSFKRTLFMCDV